MSDVRIFDFTNYPPVFGQQPALPRWAPDRSSEIEAGFDAGFSPGSARLSVTGFQRRERIQDLFILVARANDANASADRRVSGAELLAEATAIETPAARLHLRGQLAFSHDRVSRSGLPNFFVQSAGGVTLAVIDGQSWGAWRGFGYGWNDANHDGRIEWSELTTANPTAPSGRSRPSRFAALAGDLAFAQAFTLTAKLDHVGGFDEYDLASAVQCGAGVCPALNDPAASLSDQARALAAHSRISYAGFIVPGDATTLREVSLSWHSEAVAARLRAASMKVTVSAYDLASWTRSKGIHPETDLPGPGDQSNLLASLVQPIPRTVALRVALTY